MNRSGAAYVTPAILDGRWMVRVSIGALPTEHAHVEALWALLRREAEGSLARRGGELTLLEPTKGGVR